MRVDSTNTNTSLCSAFAEELARSGMRLAVVSPGSRSTPLAIALFRQEGIEVEVALDERSASFFALGAAQSTGLPVALVCTSGTAAANYHPAVAEADLSAVPLVVLTADRPPELRDVGAGQTIDQIKLFGSSVRWFTEVGSHDADDSGLLHYRSLACRAWATASGDPRPGPVHLNFPLRDPLAPIEVPGAVTAERRLALEGRGDAPLTQVDSVACGADLATVSRVVSMIESADRILILAGRQTDPGIREPLGRLAEACRAPVLAEPTSQFRHGPHDRGAVVTAYERIAARRDPALAPELVIRLGEFPTSKRLRIWLSELDSAQIVIDPDHGWYEPTRTADLILRCDPATLLHQIENTAESRVEGPVDSDFRDGWMTAEDEERAEIERSWLATDGLAAGLVQARVAELQEPGSIVYTASSMAIRDQEESLPSLDKDLCFLANRGANGIDGLVASGLGAARATGLPTTIVTGDLGFFHDVGSLALGQDLPAATRIVVLDNDGGAIFERLPQRQAIADDEFEALMRTPSGLSVEDAARLYRLPFAEAASIEDLDHAFAEATPGPAKVIRVAVAG
ncbi:MAG: 2-succinyl-5-enolpyruvyl-6-hydroxy-3-cyclohexene-1-carboxylic-acid synthase [Solirubrobacterales bacterium]|nr:2-succinyl-5-enolpyruvyl-6-hydroxy-3-cyclohexene-1-carboxylic-acid synthase [Solirubrobacterales bacterium]